MGFEKHLQRGLAFEREFSPNLIDCQALRHFQANIWEASLSDKSQTSWTIQPIQYRLQLMENFVLNYP